MDKKEQLYEGKAKKVFATENPELYKMCIRDRYFYGNRRLGCYGLGK